MTLTTIECAMPGASYTLFGHDGALHLHLAAPSEHGTGPILCGFDRFQRDDDGHFLIGFSVGGGTVGPTVKHVLCSECAALRAGREIRGSNAHKFEVFDESFEEARRAFPDSVDVETGQPVDDWGYTEAQRHAFIRGAVWQANR